MLIVCKATSEVVAAIATLNQNAPVSLPVPSPFSARSLLVCVYLPRVQVDPCFRRFCRIRVYFCTAVCLSDLGKSRLAPVSRFLFFVLNLLRESLAYCSCSNPRSGTYYYKPDNRHSCCPQYTIRYFDILSPLAYLLIYHTAWMRQLLTREETSVKRSTDGISTSQDLNTPTKRLDIAQEVESKYRGYEYRGPKEVDKEGPKPVK